MWKDIGKACGWKHPRSPEVKWLWEEKATGTFLSFLESTRVGEVVNVRRLWEDEEEEASLSEVKEDGADPP